MSKRKFSDSVTALISTRHPKNDDPDISNGVLSLRMVGSRTYAMKAVLEELKFPLVLQGIIGGYFGHRDYRLGVFPFNEHFSTCSQLCKENLVNQTDPDWYETAACYQMDPHLERP